MFLIVIPTYNRAKLLERCIQSILKQDYIHYQILVLDDNSSDETPKLMEHLANERLIYHRFLHNHGHGDRVMLEAINLGLLRGGEWIICVSDDEYFYTTNHLSCLNAMILKHPKANLLAMEQGYDYGGIALLEQDKPILPEFFCYANLNPKQKRDLQRCIKNAFRRDFLISSGFFDRQNQNTDDVIFEGDGAYLNLYDKAQICFVPLIAHIFGITPNARQKYLNFYNWIVSCAMSARCAKDEQTFYELLHMNYAKSYPIFLNAFFDWGGESLALLLKQLYHHPQFPKIVRDLGAIYQDAYGDLLFEHYSKFNSQVLLSQAQREELIASSFSFVIYPHNSWSGQIQAYLESLGKEVLFIADDFKEGSKGALDIVEQKERIDCVFLCSGHPKVIYTLASKLQNQVKIATLILKD